MNFGTNTLSLKTLKANILINNKIYYFKSYYIISNRCPIFISIIKIIVYYDCSTEHSRNINTGCLLIVRDRKSASLFKFEMIDPA